MHPTTQVESVFNRPRWTESDAREVLAALDRSGKPVSVFAAEHGLMLSACIFGDVGSAEPSVPRSKR